MAYMYTRASQERMEQLFQLASARRAKALSSSMQPPELTPAKISNKRAQKTTPVDMTPTPTPGQKHFKAQESPAGAALKKLSFGEESTSTEAPPGPNHFENGCLKSFLYILHMYSPNKVATLPDSQPQRRKPQTLSTFESTHMYTQTQNHYTTP